MSETIYTFYFPDIGEGVIEGEIIEWLKNVGDIISKDEPIVSVMTDKATVELSSPYPGILLNHYYKRGESAIKDTPLFDIQLPEGVILSSRDKKTHDKPLQKVADSISKSLETRCFNEKALATPKVRHLALIKNIDIEKVKGTGKEGRVLEADLENQETEKLISKGQALRGLQGFMAKKMDQRAIPQFSYFEQTEVSRLIELRNKVKVEAKSQGLILSYMPFLLKALSLTIKKYPILNSSIDMEKGEILFHTSHNIGIAMATPNGLIVPVLKNIEGMNFQSLVKAYEELKLKVKEEKLLSSDMKEGTITVSNFGVLEGDGLFATPLISEPEIAILAMAKIREAPVVKNGEVVVRPILPLSWSFDHRILDGAKAAAISHFYCNLLKDPVILLY